MNAGFTGFRPDAFRFLEELGEHNERAWFQANRATYEQELLQPARDLDRKGQCGSAEPPCGNM